MYIEDYKCQDKNFHIYVHGHLELIEQVVDEHGWKFYKIYYSEEY